MVQPLRVEQTDQDDSDIGITVTEIGELPDELTDRFSREMTEVVPKEKLVELDKDADRWERMLRLDRKANSEIDEDWLRAARGHSEYGRFGLWAVGVIIVGLLVGWQADLQIQSDYNVPFFAPADPSPEAGPVEMVNEPEPEVLPAEATPTDPAPDVTPEPVPPPPPKSAVVPAPAPKASPPPQAPKAKPAPRKSVPKVKEAPPSPPKATPAPAAKAPPAPPPPPPAPPAAEQATPATAGIRVTGDAHRVQFVRNGQRINSGRVAPGSYNIEVRFRPGDAPQRQGSLTIAAGETALINCKVSFHRCTVRGPWK
jgi:hypothetical protein